MAEVDFYVLAGDRSPDPQQFVCRLLDTVHRRGGEVHVHVADEAAAPALDARLWSFNTGWWARPVGRRCGSAGSHRHGPARCW